MRNMEWVSDVLHLDRKRKVKVKNALSFLSGLLYTLSFYDCDNNKIEIIMFSYFIIK